MLAIPAKNWLTVAILICGLTLSHAAHKTQAEDILVFAAASLGLPLQEIANHHTKTSQDRIRISFAASSTLARQISKGAPADIYISANQKWMDYLAQKRPTLRKRAFLSNDLILVSPAGTQKPIKSLSLKSFGLMLGDGRLAMGDPDHVPVGLYGAEALKSLKLWTPFEKRLARLNNARAVLAFVERGETPLGIVYRSDAHNNQKLDVLYTFPASSHARITYWLALTSKDRIPAARRFLDAVLSTGAKDVFKRYGFLVN